MNTTDHGRGWVVSDWSERKMVVPGFDENWVYFRSPGIPMIGETRGGERIVQCDFGSFILSPLGQPSELISGTMGRPIFP